MCVCVFSSHSFWTSSSLAVPAGVTQEEGHTGFLIHLLSAVRALIFLYFSINTCFEYQINCGDHKKSKEASQFFSTSNEKLSLGCVWVTRSSMLDCHVLKAFGIYMIGILDHLY